VKTAFLCSHCRTRLLAKPSLAGRTSRCPKCGQSVLVPAVGTAAAGDWRAAVSQQLEPQQTPLARAREGSSHSTVESDTGYRLKSLTPVGTPKLDATAKPRPKAAPRPAASGARPVAKATGSGAAKAAGAAATEAEQELAELFGDEGEVAFEFNPPEPVVAPSQVRSEFADLLRIYRSVFSLLARGTQAISEASYTISFILLIQAIAGGIMGHHGLASLGLGLIVVLNLVGFVGDLASLVMLSFRKDPMQGLLFLLPPYAVYYLWTDWKRYQEVVGRMRIPLLMLVLVGIAYSYVPWLSAGQEQASAERAVAEQVDGEPPGVPSAAVPDEESGVVYGVGLVETAAEWVWSLVGGEPKQQVQSQGSQPDPAAGSED
jgi:DNA-directed RNA polymerase subunit RPC12/RpoP